MRAQARPRKPRMRAQLQSRIAAAQHNQRTRRGLWWIGGALGAFAILGGLYLASQLASQWMDASRALPASSVSSPASPSSDADAGNAESVIREQFMRELTEYESDTEPQIDAMRLDETNPTQDADLRELKQQAIARFGAGDYLQAREKLREAKTLFEQIEARRDEQLQSIKRDAQAAFADNRAEQAQQLITRALQLRADDVEMINLQARVAVLPAVLDALAVAEVARIENRPQNEIAALSKAHALDPARSEVQTRLEKVRAEYAKQQLRSSLANAARALNAGDLQSAKKHLANAEQVAAPGDAQVARLAAQLQQATRAREFDDQLRLAEFARQQDDWQQAHTRLARAVQLRPDNPRAVDAYRQATQLLEAMRRIDALIVNAARLSDENVAAATSSYLTETESLTKLSAKFAARHAELTRLTAQYGESVEVAVVSDNATEIIVRGVGRVGKTKRRTIRLRPGNHTFEGSRRGYQSKLVAVEIKPGAAGVEVTVICDVKI